MPQRTYYIDRLRVLLTALVLFHHTAITYGAAGGWFYYELHPSAAGSSLLLTTFCAINQAYFMGFFFLLAGYFTPGSYQRKGWCRFLLDRAVRLVSLFFSSFLCWHLSQLPSPEAPHFGSGRQFGAI
jgi:peptidoglycan/LPS O-acetylase OafA/YrhL